MNEEELEKEFIAALNAWVNLSDEYTSRFTSIKPLGYEKVPIVDGKEIEELTLKIHEAERIYLELRKLRYGS